MYALTVLVLTPPNEPIDIRSLGSVDGVTVCVMALPPFDDAAIAPLDETERATL
jgi:hypothetical protein